MKTYFPVSIVVLTYNRINSLRACLNAIYHLTPKPYELFVVNNASSDGTKEWLDSKPFDVIPIHLETNMGVIARNIAFESSRSEFIAQIDDDVIVRQGWLEKCLSAFDSDPSLGMIGQQGGLIKKWLDIHSHINHTYNGYVDYLTGFCLVFRNVGLKYDAAFGRFWHEELDLCLQFKYAGYRLKVLPDLCIHRSLRNEPIDWALHDRNLNYCYVKWKNKIDELRLEGLKAPEL